LRFAALWVQRAAPGDDARVVLAPAAEIATKDEEQKSAGLAPAACHAWRQPDGTIGFSGVWHSAAGTPGTGSFQSAVLEENLRSVVAGEAGSLIDLDVAPAPQPPTSGQRAATALKAAQAAIKAKPDDLEATLRKARASFQRGEYSGAIEDLNAVVEGPARNYPAYRLRAIAHARLGHADEARADLEMYRKGKGGEWGKLYLAVVVASELGQGMDDALAALDAALQQRPQDSSLHYEAARACAQASGPLARSDPVRGRALVERAVALLREAIASGYSDYGQFEADADLDPLRDLPAFAALMKAGRRDRFYPAVWAGDSPFESSPLFGLDPATHLERCRELAAEGYRMAAVSVARTSTEGPPLACSVWHRPVISEEARDRLAERQARAAIALFRIGKLGEVMPLLRHSADPRLRSFIINWLSPLGADAAVLATALDGLPIATRPTPAQSQSFRDAVLFHAETSQRRALILALGTYAAEGLSAVDREPLTSKLLDVYRTDPDSGIHGAAAWTLSQWGQRAKLAAIDAELARLSDRGDRRWFVNSQGQTFAVIGGPVEFRMGSPPADPDRVAPNEILHHRLIRRRFAIAATEVSVRQFQAFLHDTHDSRFSYLTRYSPDPDGPQVGTSWYQAAAYCNWLSRREGLPECYEPNPSRQDPLAMKIKPDALSLGGYRLPTEGEWEYACRAGAETSRYFGASVELLGRYAWYNATAQAHAWRCGSLLPNELGLFDMLGNAHEWGQDVRLPYRADSGGQVTEPETIINSLVDLSNPRQLRGGAFINQQANLRSAYRAWSQPSGQNTFDGFRPSRTLN
jgi:formylglycine-generating enzyme required for sulfatase activity